MRTTKTRKLNLQRLEDRAVPAFGFGSAFHFGNTGYDVGHDIAIDSAGSIYLSGYYSGTVDFDPNGTNPSSNHVLSTVNNFQSFAAKYLPDGTFQWATDLGTGAYSAIDVQGANVFVAVSSWIGSSGGPYDMYAHQLNASDGSQVWTTFLGSAPAGSARIGVAAGPAGSAYITGNNSLSQAFVTKLNSAGSAQWTRTSTGGSAMGYGIAVDAAGNAYASGGFTGTVSFGSVSFASWSGTEDAFVWKIDSNGNSVKAVDFRSNGLDRGWNLAIDNGGNVVVTGEWGNGGTNVSQNNDFDPSNKSLKLGHNGMSDSFVVKLNSSLQLSWAKSFGGSNMDFGRAVAIDGANNVYTTGSFTGPVDFNPGPQKFNVAGYGNRDIYVSKLNASGNFVDAAAMGGSVYDDGTGIALDGSSNVWTTGGFRGTADFDPTSSTYFLTQAGYPGSQIYDAFVSMLTQPAFRPGDEPGEPVADLSEHESISSDNVAMIAIPRPRSDSIRFDEWISDELLGVPVDRTKSSRKADSIVDHESPDLIRIDLWN